MRKNGLPEEFAQRVYQQIQGFGEYGFPESHAASFALLVYASAWLKCHYPAAFAAAMINSQPLGFYAPAQLVRDARDHGVEVRPADVNQSDWDCRLEGGLRIENGESAIPGNFWVPQSEIALRLGLRMVTGLREAFARTIEQVRAAGLFVSIDDFARRTGLAQGVIKRLAEADAFSSLGASRRQAIWQSLAQEKKPRAMPLFEKAIVEGEGEAPAELNPINAHNPAGASLSQQGCDDAAALPPMSLRDEVVADYRSGGLSLRAHPISFHRPELDRLGITSAAGLAALANEAPVRVAGLVLLRQRPGTAKGITFVTLEDETGVVNLVVHQHTWDRYYRVARRAPAWIAHGHVQTTRGEPASRKHATAVIHVVVHRLEALDEGLAVLEVKSRDFR
jgi:error-prone DNA polymerase